MMRPSLAILAVFLTVCTSSVLATRRSRSLDGMRPFLTDSRADDAASGQPENPFFGRGRFDQWIDHENHELGTFPQRYTYNTTYWKGEGSPVVFVSSGEDDYEVSEEELNDSTMIGLIARQLGAAMLLVEHRGFGESYVYWLQTAKNLSYLTPEQVAADHARITRELRLPMDPKRMSNAPNAPWIWVGGSYFAGLGAAQERFSPGSFWVTYGSSSAVQPLFDDWQFFVPVEKYMPRNCSNDLQAMFKYIDNILINGTEEEQYNLKAMFRLEGLDFVDDFVAQLSGPIDGYWIGTSVVSELVVGQSDFFKMCDYIETGNLTAGTYETDTGIGAELATQRYGEFLSKKEVHGICNDSWIPDWSGPWNTKCFDTHNSSSPIYTDMTPNNVLGLPWYWIRCTWAMWGLPSAPPDYVPISIISRLRTPYRMFHMCENWWPDFDFSVGGDILADKLIRKTGGWDYTGPQRSYWTHGDHDGFREMGIASDFRQGGPFLSDTGPIRSVMIPGGFHMDDWYINSGEVNSDILAVQNDIIAQIDQWTKEFYDEKGLNRTG